MTNVYKLSVDDIKRVSTDYSKEFALARIAVLSTKPNSHKIPITDELLRKSGDSIKGKWVIAEYDRWKRDVTTHTPNTKIIGIIPNNAEIEYVVDEFGDTTMYVDAVISKLYATDVYDLFVKDNFRNVSVEMSVIADDENYINGVEELIFYSVCVLGKDVNGSCPNANMEIIRFSADEANKYFDNKISTSLEKMEQLTKMAKRYKVDKTAKSLSDDDWSNVDKTELRNTVINAQNKSELVKSVYLKVEDDWEDAPSEKLGYPVMQLKGGKFVYNRNALANAKARATQQNESEVLNKLEDIYKKLKLDDGKDEKMSKQNDETRDVVMEEEVKAQEEQLEEMGCGEKLEDENKNEDDAVTKESEDTSKMEEDNESDSDDDSDDKEDEKKDDEKMSELLAEKDAKIAEQETKLAELNTQLAELTKFKADIEEKERMSIVVQTLAKIKERVSDEDYAKFEESGKSCKFEEVTAWKNEVLANLSEVLMSAEKSENHLRMDIGNIKDDKETTSLWDRL